LYTGMIVVSALVVMLLSEAKQIPLILLTQVANGMLLPFVLISMIRLSNRKDLMGNYRNTPVFNTIAWVTAVVMAGLTLLLVVSAFFPNRVPL